MDNRKMNSVLARRRLLQMLAAAGVAGPGALAALAQSNPDISPEILEAATALLDQEFTDERLEVIAPALEGSLSQFQIVRDFELDDMIEPAPVFKARVR